MITVTLQYHLFEKNISNSDTGGAGVNSYSMSPQEMRTAAIARPLEINETEKALRAAIKEVLVWIYPENVIFFGGKIHTGPVFIYETALCGHCVGKCGEDQRHAGQCCVWWNQSGQQDREEETGAGEESKEAPDTAECQVSSQPERYQIRVILQYFWWIKNKVWSEWEWASNLVELLAHFVQNLSLKLKVFFRQSWKCLCSALLSACFLFLSYF